MVRKATVITIAALAATGAIVVLATRGKAAPPPPEPGLANLYGTVVDAVTGRQLADVLVELNGTTILSDSQGYYQFLNIEPGGYLLTFSKAGYETLTY